ncbi:MAG: diguanylate cyclase [Vicinamibacterales bacterium]
MPSLGLLALPSLVGVGASLAIAWLAWQRRPRPTWPYMIALGLAVAWWCAGQSVWVLVGRPGVRMLAAKLQYLGITTAPVCYVLLAGAFTLPPRWLRPLASALFVVPAITLLLVATNDTHALIWRQFDPIPGQARAAIVYGPWFSVHTVYSYALAIGGTVLLGMKFAASPHYRPQLALAIGGPMVVLGGNLLQLTRGASLPLDPTPSAFAVSFAAIAWAVLRHNYLDLAPVARSVTVEGLIDGVLVTDQAGRIVDANPAARALIGQPAAAIIGRGLGELLPAVGDLRSGETREVRLGHDRRIEARMSPVASGDGDLAGRVLVLRDVTAEREAQDRLVAAQAALHELNRELERLAHTDALTGLANRRLLMARLDEEWSRARRRGRDVSLLMIDIDHFKTVNDTHGHLTGDRVLAAVGRALLGQLRGSDAAARYGGEELAVLLPETDPGGALEAAQRIRHTLAALRHHDDAGGDVPVTLSIGVATIRADDGTAQDLLSQADAALYHAKTTGRDGIARATAGGFERLP